MYVYIILCIHLIITNIWRVLYTIVCRAPYLRMWKKCSHTDHWTNLINTRILRWIRKMCGKRLLLFRTWSLSSPHPVVRPVIDFRKKWLLSDRFQRPPGTEYQLGTHTLYLVSPWQRFFDSRDVIFYGFRFFNISLIIFQALTLFLLAKLHTRNACCIFKYCDVADPVNSKMSFIYIKLNLDNPNLW